MSKINKLGKSTFVIAILSFLLVAVLGFGGTYAYFNSNTDKVGGQFTTGHVTMEANTDKVVISAGDLVVPGQPIIEEKLTVTTKTNVDSVLFAVVTAKVEGAGTTIEIGKDKAIDMEIATGWVPLETNTNGTLVYVFGTESNGIFNDGAITGTAHDFTTDKIYLDREVKGVENMDVKVTLEIQFFITQASYLGATNGANTITSENKGAAACYNAAKTYVFNAPELALPELKA